ncbi:glycosyltransferase family 4 protein [Desulfofalx alkaliphila]|uniref:glycosyltransferase family 4 protein n=1 Tax=Desulfofalx alkaliphila TaxID=105483 RepID=UPI00068A8292|nr:glycosyltransferase family 4 protein [Desulfofalx alkaliphila]
MSRITVLHVIRPAAGGMKNHLLDLVRHTDHSRYKIIVACPGGSEVEKELKEDGVAVLPIQLKGNLSPSSDLLAAMLLARYLKQYRVTILHTHSSKAALVSRTAALLCKTPIVLFTVHNSIFYADWSPLKKKTMATVEKILANGTDRIITVSEALRREIITREQIPEDKVVTVYNGIDIDRIQQKANKFHVCKQLGLPPMGKLVGVIARLAPQKGVTYFLQAAAMLKEYQVNFIVVGDGPLGQQLQAEAEQLGLEGRVFFTGHRNDIARLLAALDVFVLPSVTEGLPLTILEALAARRPVVAAGVGGIPEVIQHDQTGILVEPKEPVALAAAIGELLNNPAKAKKLGEAGRRLVEKKFTVEKMAQNIMEIYNQVLLEKGLAPDRAMLSYEF